jgi:uncharacterized protein (TIGR02246 family)
MANSPKFLTIAALLVIVLLAGTTWAFAQDTIMDLSDLTCTAGQIAVFDGTTWACGDNLMEMQAQLDAVQIKIDPEAEFKEVVIAYEEAYKAGDVDKLMQLYSDDVVTMLPGLPPLEGKEAVRADWEYFFDTYSLERDAELVYMDVSGDRAVRRMEWTNTLTPKDGGEPFAETGTCVVGFKRIDDEWKVVYEIASVYPN